MKRSEVKIKVKVTFRQILDAPLLDSWDEMCNKYGINPYCISEGLADGNETIKITLEEAEDWGIIEKE